MYIKNLEEVINRVVTDKEIALTVLEQYVQKSDRPGDYYNCPTCGGKIGLYKEKDGIYMVNCFNHCIKGTILEFIADRENLNGRVEAVLFLKDKFNLQIEIEADRAIDKLDSYLSKGFKPLDGQVYLRHHYYKYMEDGTERIDSSKVLYRDTKTGKKLARWFIISRENDTYRAELSNKAKQGAGEQRAKKVILYNSHKIKSDTSTICIAEGEKDADTLCRLGFLGVSAQESSRWDDEYTEQIKNCHQILIFTDNDSTGAKYANSIIAHLEAEFGEYNHEKVIKIVDLPDIGLKSDITDYVEYLQDKGLNKSQIVEDIKSRIYHSENVLSIHEIHSSKLGVYKWALDKNSNGEIPKYSKVYITDFEIKVIQYVECLDDDDLSHFIVEVTPQRGNKFTRRFSNNDMNDIGSFKQALQSPYCTFSGKQVDLDALKKRIFNLNYPTKKVLTYGGMRFLDNQWVYVENEHCLIDKKVTDEYTINNTTISIKSDILSSEIITPDEIKELGQHIFKFNSQPVVYSVLGYAVATFLKARLKQMNIKFPHMLSVGEAGAGKSETLQNILLPMFGLSGMESASNITKYSVDNYAASNNTIPLVLDEYKPYMMAKWRVEMISDIMRNTYDGLKSLRGTGKGTVKELEPRTNIVLNGEAGTDETAVIERSVLLSFSKRDTLIDSQTDAYMWVKEHRELLTKLSATIIRKVIKLEDATIKTWYDKSLKLIPKEVKASRIRNSLAINGVGLMMLGMIFKDFNAEQAIQVISQNSINEVGEDSKSIVDLTLEAINQALPTIILDANDDYSLFKLVNKNTQLALRINTIYPQFTKYIKNFNTGFVAINQNEFVKMLTKSGYYAGYKAVVFNLEKDSLDKPKSKRIKAYILDIGQLGKLNMDNFIDEEDGELPF